MDMEFAQERWDENPGLQRYEDTYRIPIVAVTAYPYRDTVSDVLRASP